MEADPNVRARRGVWWAGLMLSAVYAGFVAYVMTSSEGLPERVATHFNLAGRADAWMDRSTHVWFMAGAGFAVPAVVVGVLFAVRFVSDDFVNLPHKAYWLGEGRRRETMDYLLRHAMWLGCWVVLLFVALQYLLVEANGRAPARLGEVIWGVVGAFVAGVAAWVGVLAWHFGRAPRTSMGA